MICCWAMGITQHKNGVANVQSIVNFALLRGQIGRRGAGLCPVRGHSNVQGDRTVGIWEKMSDAFLEALGNEFRFQPPRKHGFDTVRTIQAMHEGRVKVFVGLGGNFLSASPDTHYTSEAMARCRLTVQIATKLNRGHLITGAQALLLPCLGRTEKDVQASGEQFVTVEDTTGVVHASRGVLEPGVAASAQRARHRRRDGDGDAGRTDDRRLGRARSTTTTASASTSSTSSPGSCSTTGACGSRAASTCRTDRAKGRSRRRRSARGSPCTRSPSGRWRRGSCC